MQVIESRINPSDEVFRTNEERLRGLVAELRARTEPNRQVGAPRCV